VTAIYLVRAGRTRLSEEGRLQGRRDVPLTDAGMNDALHAGHRLAEANVAAVFASPLRRARQTADVICRVLGTSCRTLAELIDVDVGRWAGMTMAQIIDREPLAFDWYFRMPLAATYPSGEQIIDAERRVFEALESITGVCPGRAAVAITHEMPIRSILVRVRRLEGTAFWDPHVPPGSVTELRATEDGFELPTVLEDLLRAADGKRNERERR